MSNHALEWDELILTGDYAGDEPYWFRVKAEGASFGDSEPVEVGLSSLMLDGSLSRIVKHENRRPTFLVEVGGSDARALAEGEAALFTVAQRDASELRWTPPDYFGDTSVFDVLTARLDFLFEDMAELRLTRTYRVTWQCAPFARAAELTVMPAVSSSATLTVIDDCTNAAGWSASDGTAVVSSGSVIFTESTGDGLVGVTRPGNVSMAGMKYVIVDWKTSVPAGFAMYEAKESYREASPLVAGYTRTWFYQPSSVTFVSFLAGSLPAGATLSIAQVSKAEAMPDSSTAGHQRSLVISSSGSARTQAQIEVSTPTNGLGVVVLYTSALAQAHNPSIRRWLIQGSAPITNAAGSYHEITSQITAYDVPVATLPHGRYVVWARASCETTTETPIFWGANTRIGSTDLPGESHEETYAFTANKWMMIPLGFATLPPTPVGPAGVVRIAIQAKHDGPVIYLYDIFLAHEDSDLTVIDCGLGASAPGGSSRRMRVLPPSAVHPGGTVERGHAADWSDGHGAGLQAISRSPRGHVLHQGGTSVVLFTEGTPNGQPATVTASWHERFHTHVVSAD